MSVVWTTDDTHMSSAVSVLAVAGFVPLALALNRPTTRLQPLYVEAPGDAPRPPHGSRSAHAGAAAVTRVRPRTALQVAACLFNANVPWGTAQFAVERVTAGEVELAVLVEWLESFGETATVFALVAGMDTDDLRAILSGREHLDIDSLRLLAQRKGEI